jgi:Mo-dependent nitrogenase C-terminus
MIKPTTTLTLPNPFHPLQFLRNGVDTLEVNNPTLANLICDLIPAACPFARDLHLFRYTITIPPLCKINPLYEQLMGLRFRALMYLDSVH